MSERNPTIDFAKYTAAVFIIGIHTLSVNDYNEAVMFFIVNVLFRMAVPFFAISTGYFIAGKIQDDDAGIYQNAKRIILKQEIKLLKLYVICSAVYLIFSIASWIETGWFSLWAFVDYGLAAVVQGSHYHLWYLLSVIYALPLLWICIRFIKPKCWPALIGVLWIIKAFSYGYTPFTSTLIKSFIDKAYYFSGLLDGLFCILPLLLTGFLIQKSQVKVKYSFLLWLVSFGALTGEAFLLKFHGQTNVSFVFFTLPTAYFGFLTIIKHQIPIKQNICTALGKTSIFIYCFHPLIIESIQSLQIDKLLQFCLVSVASTLFGLALHFVIQRRKNRLCSN